MRQIREGVKKMERIGKIERARDGVLDYRLGHGHGNGNGNGNRKDKGKDAEMSMPIGSARGWGSVVEERIRAAQEAGVFKHNKLRGKPLERDMDEHNPFLNREEVSWQCVGASTRAREKKRKEKGKKSLTGTGGCSFS